AGDVPQRGHLARSAHDLARDGRAELVVLTRGAVSVLRLGANGAGVALVEVARAELPADVPLAPVPTRRALATSVERDGAVIVRSSRLAAPLRVELHGGALNVSRASGPCADAQYPLDRGCASRVEGRDFFDEAIAPFAESSSAHAAAGHFYTHASRRVRTPEGTVLDVEAIVTPHGRLALRIDGRSIGAVGYGTALAL